RRPQGALRRARPARAAGAFPFLAREAASLAADVLPHVPRPHRAAVRTAVAAAGAPVSGRAADDGLRRARRRPLRAVAAAVGQRRLGPARDDLALRHELRVLAFASQPAP